MSTRPPTPVDFGRFDLAEPVDSAPLVFDSLRVGCRDCGNVLINKTYEFFPNTLFITGVCLKCGPRTAMFVPPVNETETEKFMRHHAELQAFADALPVQYKEAEDTIVADFLAWHAEKQSA